MPGEEQERLSAEEMLLAAKGETSSSGNKSESREVIVQEDGTKVVRVKRRKKKSRGNEELLNGSDISRAQNFKILIISLLGLLLLSAVFIGLVFYRVVSLNKPTQIKELHSLVNQNLNAQSTIKGYRVGFDKVSVDKLKIESGTVSAIGYSLDLNEVEANLDTALLLCGKLSGNVATAQSGELELYPSLFKNAPEFSQPWDSPYSHDTITVKKINVKLGENHNSAIKGAEGSFRKRANNELQVSLRKGQLVNPGALPPVLNSGRLTFKQDMMKLDSLALSDGAVGIMELSGDLNNTAYPDFPVTMTIKQMKLGNLNAGLAKVLSAKITANKGAGVFNLPNMHYELSAPFHTSESGLTFKRFQFISDLASRLGALSQPEIIFDDLAEGNLKISNRGYEFTKLRLYTLAGAKVKGNMSVDLKGNLTGELSVGVPVAKVLQAFPKAKKKNLELESGYLFIPVNLSGTADLPKDDFLPNLVELIK